MARNSMAAEVLKMWRGGELDPDDGEPKPADKPETDTGPLKVSLGEAIAKKKRTDFSKFRG